MLLHLNVRSWFVVVVHVKINFSILKFEVIVMTVYGYHTDRTHEFIGPHI